MEGSCLYQITNPPTSSVKCAPLMFEPVEPVYSNDALLGLILASDLALKGDMKKI